MVKLCKLLLMWVPIAMCGAAAVWFLLQDTALGAQGAVMVIFVAGMWWSMNVET
jgi:hypothetical protein